MKNKLVALVLTTMACVFAPAHAGVLAQSNFNTGNDGWSIGDFSFLSGTTPANWDSSKLRINTIDTFGNVAFIAPTAYLGDKSAAFAQTFEFELGDRFNDGLSYAPLALISGSTVLYATRTNPPSVSDSLTKFTITLTGANFFTGNPFAGATTTATDEQLKAVLANLSRIAILADWNTGDDFAQLDNVVLNGSDTSNAVPEPSSLPLLLAGFVSLGFGARRLKSRK